MRKVSMGCCVVVFVASLFLWVSGAQAIQFKNAMDRLAGSYCRNTKGLSGDQFQGCYLSMGYVTGHRGNKNEYCDYHCSEYKKNGWVGDKQQCVDSCNAELREFEY